MKKTKWAAATIILALAGSQISGCTTEEVLESIGAIAIVGGAVAIGATTHCEGGYTNVCTDYTDYFGRLHTDCREEYDSCATLVPNNEGIDRAEDRDHRPVAKSKKKVDESIVTDTNWGSTFHMSFDASAQVIDAMKKARTGDASGLQALGLTEEDVAQIANMKLPSDSAIDAVAQRLDTDKSTVAQMIQRLIDIAQKQKQ